MYTSEKPHFYYVNIYVFLVFISGNLITGKTLQQNGRFEYVKKYYMRKLYIIYRAVVAVKVSIYIWNKLIEFVST